MSEQDIDNHRTQNVKDLIAQAVGVAWAEFKLRHPAQASGAASMVAGEIVPELVAMLERDDDYDDLVRVTERETNIGRVVEAITPVAMRILTGVLAA